MLILFSSLKSVAAFYVGFQNNSWQDVVPVKYVSNVTNKEVNAYALMTFSTLSLGGGYEGSLAQRWRYNGEAFLHNGTADLVKISDAKYSPRLTASSIWVSGKVAYRISKTFSIGPQFTYNSIQVKDLGSASNVGFLINTDVEMYENLRLIQTMGTMNDSGTVAYTLGLQKMF